MGFPFSFLFSWQEGLRCEKEKFSFTILNKTNLGILSICSSNRITTGLCLSSVMETKYMLFICRVGGTKVQKSKWSQGYFSCKYKPASALLYNLPHLFSHVLGTLLQLPLSSAPEGWGKDSKECNVVRYHLLPHFAYCCLLVSLCSLICLDPEHLWLLFNSPLHYLFFFFFIMEIKHLKGDLNNFFFCSKRKLCIIFPANVCDKA